MKFLLVIDSLGSGGAQRLFVHLAKALSDKGHEVELFTYEKLGDFFNQDFTSRNIKIHSFEGKKKGFSFKILLKLRKLMRSDFNCVIATMHSPSIYAALANLGVGQNRLIVCEVSSSLAPVSLVKRFFFIVACIVASNVVTNSYKEADNLARLPILKKKLKTIWNGYQIQKFTFNSRVKTNKEKLRILIVGRVAHPKNGVNVLKAIQMFFCRNGWMPTITWAGRNDEDARSLKMQNNMNLILNEDSILRKNFAFIGEVRNIEQ